MADTRRIFTFALLAGWLGAAVASAEERPAPPVVKASEAPSAKADEKSGDRITPDRRSRAGLRAGSWNATGLENLSGADYSESPTFEGYFEKDLDVRLSIESSAGVWMRSRKQAQSDLTGTSTEEVNSYIVPMFSSLKFYPLKHVDRRWTPYLGAGIGLALGLEKRNTTGTLFPAGDGSTTAMGFGYKAGTGLDWNLGKAFGVTFSGRYQWLRFEQDLGGDKTYRGFVVETGLTYRFQRD